MAGLSLDELDKAPGRSLDDLDKVPVQVMNELTGKPYQIQSFVVGSKTKRGEFPKYKGQAAVAKNYGMDQNEFNRTVDAFQRSGGDYRTMAGILAANGDEPGVAQTLFPAYSAARAAQVAGLDKSANPSGRALIGDALGNVGRGARSAFSTFGELLSRGADVVSGHGYEERNGKAVPRTEYADDGTFANLARVHADPRGAWGDPGNALALVPMVGAERLAGGIAGKAIPGLSRVFSRYPRSTELAVGLAQSLPLAYGTSLANAELSPRFDLVPAKSDATRTVASLIRGDAAPVATEAKAIVAGSPLFSHVNPWTTGAGAFGAGVGFLGRQLAEAGLMRTPGVRTFVEKASRKGRDVLAPVAELIDEPGVWGKAGIEANMERRFAEEGAATAGVRREYAPHGEEARGTLARGEFDPQFDENGVPYLTMPLEAQPHEYEALYRSGKIGAVPGASDLSVGAEPYMTPQDMSNEIAKRVLAAKYGNAEGLSGFDMNELAPMVRKAIHSVPPVAPGKVSFSDMPAYLKALNNSAFRLEGSSNPKVAGAAAAEISKIGRNVIAPLYWENPSLGADALAVMGKARAGFAKALTAQDLIEQSNINRYGGNHSGIFGDATDFLKWTLPIATRRLGQALIRGEAAANQAASQAGAKRK